MPITAIALAIGRGAGAPREATSRIRVACRRIRVVRRAHLHPDVPDAVVGLRDHEPDPVEHLPPSSAAAPASGTSTQSVTVPSGAVLVVAAADVACAPEPQAARDRSAARAPLRRDRGARAQRISGDSGRRTGPCYERTDRRPGRCAAAHAIADAAATRAATASR